MLSGGKILSAVKNECCHDAVEMFSYVLERCGNVPVTFLDHVAATYFDVFTTFPQCFPHLYGALKLV